MMEPLRNSASTFLLATSNTHGSYSNTSIKQRKKKISGKKLLHTSPRASLLLFGPVKILVLGILIAFLPITLVTSFEVSAEEELSFKPTKYSRFDKNGSYNSELSYNLGGMQPLYEITHTIIKSFIVGQEPLPEGYLNIENEKLYGPKVERNQWGELILHNWPILLITIVVALLIVLMPIVGLCFCCCRCAGNCGGRSEPFDKKHDICRRVMFGFLLILLVVGILFGVIVAFVTNTFLQFGIDRSTSTARQGGADTQEFLRLTSQQVDHILVTNYQELYNNLENILKETGTFINARLEQKSMAVSSKYLSEFLAKMPEKKRLLEQMRVITNKLRNSAVQLSNGLRGVKRELLSVLTKCNVKACQDVLVSYEIEKFDTFDIQYDRLPNVSNIIEAMDELIAKDIASAGKRGREELESLSRHLNNTIAQFIPQIMDSLKKAGDRFRQSSNKVHHELERAASRIQKETKKNSDFADEYLQEYSPYRFFAGIAVCTVLLLILMSLFVALLCGICGKRPGGYGDDCCNKGAGSRFLIIAITLIFLSISAILLFAYIHFALGVISYRAICVPMEDPKNDELFAQIDSKVDINRIFYAAQTKGNGGSKNLAPFRISDAIADCKANKTIYKVFRISNRIDIREIQEHVMQYNINETLTHLVQSVDLPNATIVILSPEDKQRILELAGSPLKEFDSSKFTDKLRDTITKHSLLEIAKQLRETEAKITSPEMIDIQGSLRNQAIHLEAYERELVIPMKSHVAELKRLAHQLDKMIRYKDRSFEESIPLLVDEIVRAEIFLNNEGRVFVKMMANNLTLYFNDEIENYVSMVIRSVEKEIGLCQPLARVYDATYVELCKRIIDPLNGFWAGCGWCALLFLPTLWVSIKLAGLYQKSDPYPGPLVESEYLYDAYSERDQIPLANGPKNKRHKKKEHRRGRGEYYDDLIDPAAQHCVPVNQAATSGARETRYNDVAPKHWNDGGPPRYQNPPMAPPASEYERPPPYYYPGATEQE